MPARSKEERMKAVFCEKLGSPEALVLREVASPTPGPGEVKVALRARGVSFVDVLMIAGQYQVKRELPFIPGGEAAGVVLETGPGVERVKPGDRVLVPGGFAEETVVAAQRVTSLPDSVSFETAAAFRSSYCTAYYALQRGRLLAGEVLLVHGAAGGVGLAAVVKTNHLLIKDAEAIGFTIGGLARLDPAREKRNFAILMGWLAAGRITPYVSHRLPLARAAEALQLIRERKVIGKAVLV